LDVTDALIALWGPPDRKARFETALTTVEVLKYAARTTAAGVVVYVTATSGPSPSGHFDEFVLGLDEAHDEVADPLARLCVFARTTPVHHGDSVPIDAPLWPGTSFQRFLAMRQVEPIVGPFDVDGRRVEFMNAIPIYEAEVPIKARLGSDDFMDELRRQRLAFWNASRPALSSVIDRR
jgi:hypothetical protein